MITLHHGAAIGSLVDAGQAVEVQRCDTQRPSERHRLLAVELGSMSLPSIAAHIARGAYLHDLGKIPIPDQSNKLGVDRRGTKTSSKGIKNRMN